MSYKLRGFMVDKLIKHNWTQSQLRKKSLLEWAYILQLVQYRIKIDVKNVKYGEHEVVLYKFMYHGLMIAEIAKLNRNEFVLTQLNRVRASFHGKDDGKGERFCTSITTMQVLDIRYWFGIETILGIKDDVHRYKKGNIGWILRRTDESINNFLKTVHQSMMLAEFHDFDVKKHAYSNTLYWSGWKILRDALKRPVWANHLIRRMSDTRLKD